MSDSPVTCIYAKSVLAHNAAINLREAHADYMMSLKKARAAGVHVRAQLGAINATCYTPSDSEKLELSFSVDL